MRELKRKDQWTEEDDRILSETIINHVQNGGTQLEAFALCAEKLSRTKAACGFRWNKTIRHQIEQPIKVKKPNSSMTVHTHLKQAMQNYDQLASQYESLQREHQQLLASFKEIQVIVGKIIRS